VAVVIQVDSPAVLDEEANSNRESFSL